MVLENVKTRTVTKLSSVTGAVSFFVVFLAVSFFGGISGGIFAVFLVFLQYRYGTETTVSHVSNTEYRYCIKIGYTAMHWIKTFSNFTLHVVFIARINYLDLNKL